MLLILLVFGSSASGLQAPSPLKAAVITDVDGTLFSFAGRDLSRGNREALAACSASGAHVCLATGRIPGPWLTALKTELPCIGPCVFGNGALVVDAEGEPIFTSSLPREIVAAVLDYTRGGTAGESASRLCVLAAAPYDAEAPYGGVRYCELSPDGAPSAITALIERAGEPDAVLLPSLDDFAERAVLKFVIWTLPGEAGWASMPDTVAALKARLAGTGATILDHGARWCEVLAPGVNKGSGVLQLLAALDFASDDVLACGDAENDVEMLRLAGVGAAMANAQPDALAAADVVVASNADDGVADAVRRFVLPPAALEFFTLDMCPYAQRCWIVLEELGLPYTPRVVNLRGNAEERAWYVELTSPCAASPPL